MEEKRIRRVFTPEQKFTMLQDIETWPTVKEGLVKYQLCHSVHQKWKRPLAVGLRASLRNNKPLKAPDLRRLEAENKKLKEVVLTQSLIICELKKEMNWDLKTGERVMSTQQAAILQMVKDAQQIGRRMGEVLATFGIKRATYYRWKKGVGGRSSSPRRAFVDFGRAHTDRPGEKSPSRVSPSPDSGHVAG